MLTLDLAHDSDDALIVRTAWLYHIVGFNQEETAAHLGLHRSRVNRLLAEARDRGLVSVTIHHDSVRELAAEYAVAQAFRLDFCLSTPAVGFDSDTGDKKQLQLQSQIARRAVGSAGANFLKGKLQKGPIKIGVSWGRTLEQVAKHLSGANNPDALFVSLMGSLTRSSASNPFEVVQAFAARTGGKGHFLPVPFIADSATDRDIFFAQKTVATTIALARSADLFLISVGELSEESFLRQQDMISAKELRSIRKSDAVCDTLGRFYDLNGHEVKNPLSSRTLAVDPDDLRGHDVILISGGLEKVEATIALLRTGFVNGLVVDGDSLLAIQASLGLRSKLR